MQLNGYGSSAFPPVGLEITIVVSICDCCEKSVGVSKARIDGIQFTGNLFSQRTIEGQVSNDKERISIRILERFDDVVCYLSRKLNLIKNAHRYIIMPHLSFSNLHLFSDVIHRFQCTLNLHFGIFKVDPGFCGNFTSW